MATKKKPVIETGWVRYRIFGRGGGGWNVDRWYFQPGIEEESAEDRREQIVSACHSWAIHAESYTFTQWIGETPPPEIIAGRMEAMMRERRYLDEKLALLSRQLSLKTQLTTI